MNRFCRSRAALAALAVLASASAACARSLAEVAEAHYAAEWADGPVAATRLGVHRGDARLDDVSLGAIAGQARRLHAEQAELAAIDPATMSPSERDDRDILSAAIARELIDDETIQPYRRDPDSYVSLAVNAVYDLIDRDFAPLPDRMRAAAARERALPALFKLAEAQLADVPQPFLDIAREDLDGSFDFVGKDAPSAFASVDDKALQDELAASTKAALAAMQGYKAFLARLPATGSFVLGQATMRALLDSDLVDAPLDEVVAAGRAQLARDRAAFLDVERRIDPDRPEQSLELAQRDHPSADRLLATVSGQLGGLQAFVEERHIVTLPSRTLPVVAETPPFERALTTAAMDWPGPFETVALASFLYVTPPDADFTPEQTEQALGDFNTAELEVLTIHEAMPGHFVQGLTLAAHPEWTLVRKAASSYATTEGWAHYAEQMVVDEGFGDGDPKLRLMQLQDALLRDCRLLAAFGMHAQGMTLPEATAMMQSECFQSPVAAAKEARRGTEDPGYYSYTLGKLMILRLREDVRRREGDAFSLGRFHDRLLAAGLAPMKIIRRELTGEDGKPL